MNSKKTSQNIKKQTSINNIYTNISLDSLKLVIEYHKLKITKKGQLALECKYIKHLETGEVETGVVGYFEDKELKENGITLVFKVREAVQAGEGKPPIPKLLEIFINSKLLKHQYLAGITEHNIKLIYNIIMDYDFFYIDYQTFIENRIVDVDIKSDISMKLEKINETLKGIEKNTINGELTVGTRNKGLQLGYRKRTNRQNSNPFIKLYSKRLELMGSSKTFFINYLQKQEIDFLRIEGTIKNNKHFQSILKNLKLTKQDLTLKSLIETKTETKIEIIKLLLSKHNDIKRKVTTIKIDKDLTHLETVYMLFVKRSIVNGETIKDILDSFKMSFSGTTYYRDKMLLLKVHKILTKDKDFKEKVYINEIVEDLLNFKLPK